MIKQIELPLRGRPILFITRMIMITDRIGLHSVLLPLLITCILHIFTSYVLCPCLGQPVHLPSGAIVYGTVKSEVVLETVKGLRALRALSFTASDNEFINMVLSSIYQRWLVKIIYSFVTVAHVGNNFSVTSLKPL